MKVNITGDNEFQGRRIMPPPWMACPYIRRSSVGWRTGFGGAYAEKFQTWLKMMTPKEKKAAKMEKKHAGDFVPLLARGG